MQSDEICVLRAGNWKLIDGESLPDVGADEISGVYEAGLRYVAEKKKLGEFAQSTARCNWYTLAPFADFVGPDLPIGRLSRRHVEKWLLSCSGIAPASMRKRLGIIRSFSKWCIEHDLLRKDPTQGIRGPRPVRALPRVVKQDGVADVLLLADERAQVMVLLGVQEGLRRAEIAGLTTDRVDLGLMVLYVLGKGRKERAVPLSEETAKAIETYLEIHPAGPGMPLLRSYKYPTQGLTPPTITHTISKLMYEAGVKKAPRDGKSAHALRHTCANDMLDAGADIREVQEMLGHDTLSSTMIYTRRQRALGPLRKAAGGRNYSG